ILAMVVAVPLLAGFGGTLNVSEDKVEQGSVFSVRYEPGTLLRRCDELTLSVYAFDVGSMYPTAFSFPMTKKGGAHVVTVSGLPADAVFLLMKVGNAYRSDGNDRKMWEVLMHSKGKPARGADFCRAFSYLGSPLPNIVRTADDTKALASLDAEIERYPGDCATVITRESVRLDRGDVTKEAYTRKVEEVLRSGFDSTAEHHVRIVSRALRTIGRPADADDLVRSFARSNPKSDMAEEFLRSACFAAQKREEFEEKVKEYITAFGYNVFSDRMYMDLINSFLQQGAGDEALRLVRAYPVPAGVRSNPPATILNMIAVSMLKQDSLLGLARQYAERAIRSAESPSERRPRFMTEMEFIAGQKEIESIAHDTYGYILMQMRKPSEAADEFRMACELLGGGATKDMLEHLASALVDAGRKQEALEVTHDAIRTARTFPQTVQRFHELSSGDVATRNKELSRLQEEARDEKRIQLRLGMMHYEIQKLMFNIGEKQGVQLKDLSFKRLDGSTVSLADLRGKVVVIDFWATWCGPCRMAMPYMQKIHEAYAGNDDVQVILANVWERTSDSTMDERFANRKNIVTKFLEQNPSYSFPMMIDVSDEIVGCFGVTGIPTKFYLDRKGVVQFKEVGVAGPDVFVDEAREKIDLLLDDAE
ncbi:MAG: redoxin family protein, partial [Candidatus Kapaibacterium sp.]